MMRKVKKNYRDKPLSLLPNRIYYQQAIALVLNHPGWFDGASSLYSGEPVKRKLNAIYNHKCAFCDQKPVGSPAQVEHFRPKKGINGTTHLGYYWLAYEWSNLLLACGNCNSTKGNHFRIRNIGARVNGPTVIAGILDEKSNFILNPAFKNEDCFLVNPETDDPKLHLQFNLDGEIDHRSDRGEESILRYDLNRDELYVNGRKTLRDGILKKFLTRLERYSEKTSTAAQVKIELVDVINEDIINPIKENKSFASYLLFILQNYRAVFHMTDKNAFTLLNLAFQTAMNKY